MAKSGYIFLLMIASLTAFSQKFVADKSFISFFSDAPVEDIQAENKKALSLFDAGTGEIVFSVPIKEFRFKKSLMEEHFNEKFMESETYPKASFQGVISGFQKENAGVQAVTAKGKLVIHGVTRDVELPGTIENSNTKLALKSVFKVKLEDYKVEIPTLLWQNIAEEVEVTIEFAYKTNESSTQ
jgi:endo-1,4-beta-mannosidase